MAYHKRILAVLACMVCMYCANTTANEAPSTREALYAAVLAEALERQPAGRSVSAEALETDPDFLRRWSAALHEFESRRIGPIQTSGTRTTQGACPKLPCGPLASQTTGRHSSTARVDTIRARTVAAGSESVLVTWDPPADALAGGPGAVAYYEVLVVDNGQYRVYRLDGFQTFGAPLRNRGLRASAEGGGSALGDPAGAGVPTHRDRRWAQQYFTLALAGYQQPSIYIRPVYAAAGYTSRDEGVGGSKQGPKPATSSATTPGPFSAPVSLNLSGAQQHGGRSGVGGMGSAYKSPLEQCVIAAIKDVRLPDPAQLESLDCTNRGIVSLTGIEQLTNLQTLTLDQNPLSDITPLSQLTNLRSLSLGFTQVHSLDALQSLVNLESLVINDTQVSSLVPLANLNQLQSVSAQNNQVDYIPDLSATNVQSLYLAGNPITDVAGVRAALTLEVLSLNGANAGDIDALIDNAEQSTVLRYVDLRGNDALYCPQLTALQNILGVAGGFVANGVHPPASCQQIAAPINVLVSSNPVVGFSFSLSWQMPAGNPGDFSYEVMRENEAGTESQLDTTPQGQTSFVNTQPLSIGNHDYRIRACVGAGSGIECGGWSADLRLTILADPDRPIDDVLIYAYDDNLNTCIEQALGGLQTLGQLTYLDCRDRGIQTLAGLALFPNLTTLILDNNQINDIEPIQRLQALDVLQLANNALSNGQLKYIALGGSKTYSTLDISNNLLSDLSLLEEPIQHQSGLSQVERLTLDYNSIVSINPLSSMRIVRLSASSNSITSIPRFDHLEWLILDNNQIASLPGFCWPELGNPVCSPGAAMADTLLYLNLDNNLSLKNLNEIDKLGSLSALMHVSLSHNSMTAVDFAIGWNSISDVYISNTPISDLSGLSNKDSLFSIDVSRTNISDFTSLVNVPFLSIIYASELPSLTSLEGFQEFHNISQLQLSESNIDPVTGLDPILEMSSDNLGFEIYLQSNGIFNIMPLVESTYGLPADRSRFFQLMYEDKVDCGQYNQAENGPYGDWTILSATCMPSIPVMQDIYRFDHLGKISIDWMPSVENSGSGQSSGSVVGSGSAEGPVDHYIVRFDRLDESGSSLPGWPQEVSTSRYTTHLDWDTSSINFDQPILVSIKSCRAIGECSPFSEPVTPVESIQAPPVEVILGSNDTASVNLNYPAPLPAGQPNIEFELHPIFPVDIPTVISESLSSGASTVSIPVQKVSLYPGLLAELYTCQTPASGERFCAEPVLVNFREQSASSDIAPITGLSIDTTNNNQGTVIRWQHPDTEVYFRIKEFADGSEKANYVIGEKAFTARRYNRESQSRYYEIVACRENSSGKPTCSDPVTNQTQTRSKELSLDFSRAVAPPYPAPAQPNNICWFDDDSDTSLVRLRWSYDWNEGMSSDEKADTPAYFSVGYCKTGQSPCSLREHHKIPFGNAELYMDGDEQKWYWESNTIPTKVRDILNNTYAARFVVRGSAENQFNSYPGAPIGVPALEEINDEYFPIEVNRCADIPHAPNRSVQGGPDDLKPGHWYTDEQPRQGWRFFWANELRLDGHHEAFDIAYDLIGFWYTYRIINGQWSPVWYYTRMELIEDEQATGGYYFEGALHYPQKEFNDLQVGTVKINLSDSPPPGMGNNQQAFMRLDVNHGEGQVVGDQLFEIKDFSTYFDSQLDPGQEGPLGGDNSTSHWNGIWTEGPLFKLVDGHLGVNDMFLVEWISGDGFSSALHFFDEADEPIWLMKFESECDVTVTPNGCNNDSHPDYSGYKYQEKMNVPFPGFNPFWDGSGFDFPDGYMEHINNFVDPATGLGRKYESTTTVHELDHLHAQYCSNVSIALKNKDENGAPVDPAHREARLNTGGSCRKTHASDASTELRKVASLHHFNYEVVGGDICDLSQGGICELELTWFTDDYFPNARPVVRDYPGGNRRTRLLNAVCSNPLDDSSWDFAVYNQTCEWDEAITNARFLLLGSSDYGEINDTKVPVLAMSRPFSASSTTVTPNPDPVPGPANEPVPGATHVSSTIGATRGNFRVTESGAATYSIPIMTVPGSGGVAPDMSLRYHSEGGAGALGRGWSVGGLSMISRCGQTLEAGDGQSTGVQLNNQDRFCLDGQRLILVSGFYGKPGSKYRTEIDNIARITAFEDAAGLQGNGGPVYFKVERKDGSIATYGHDLNEPALSSARVDVPGADMVFAWPISRIEDSASNYIDFEYFQPDPLNSIEWHPLNVHYTGHSAHLPFARIFFKYNSNPLPADRQTFRYVAGAKVMLTQQLEWVDSFADRNAPEPLRRYRIGYQSDSFGRGLLSSIQECWGTNNQNCFNPTVFEWNDGDMAPVDASGFGGVTLEGFKGGRLVDVDGDGLQDYLFLSKSGSNLEFKYLKANVSSLGVISFDSARSAPSMPASADVDNPPGWVLIDLNLDGFNDIAYYIDDQIYGQNWNAVTNSFGTYYPIQTITDSIYNRDLFAADWDGDGKTDLLLSSTTFVDPISGFERGTLYLRNTSENGNVSFDFAQSMPTRFDITGPYAYIECLNEDAPDPCGDGLSASFTAASIIEGQSADFTGDGKVEFIGVVTGNYCNGDQDCGTYSFYAVMQERSNNNIFGTTNLSVSDFIGHYAESGIGNENIEFITTADFNGDGLSDILYVNSFDQWFLRMGQGNGLGDPIRQFSLGTIRHEEADQVRFASLAGDGTLDLIGVEHLGGNNNLKHFRWLWDIPGWAAGSQVSTSFGEVNENIWSFQDVTGNSVVDTVRVRFNGSEDWRLTSARGVALGAPQGEYGYKGWFRVNKITDGFGAYTDLEYRSLAQPSVYRRGRFSDLPVTGLFNSVVYDISPAAYVVASATSLSPQYDTSNPASSSSYQANGTTRVEYYYSGARIQGGGRGFLGFREVASYDPRSGMLTRTRYRQDFPFIGLPEATRSWYLNDSPFVSGNQAATFPRWDEGSSCETAGSQAGMYLLGCSENRWSEHPTIAGLTHAYLGESEEWSFVANYTGSQLTGSTFTHRVLTENSNLDKYGNIGRAKVQTFTSRSGTDAMHEVSSQTTVNAYSDGIGIPPTADPDIWHLGRLTCTMVTSTRPGTSDVTRISTFGYDELTGFLDRETILAENCDDPEGQLKTEYLPDTFGNRTLTTITERLTGTYRQSEVVYDLKGRLVDQEKVLTPSGWVWTQKVTARDDYGNPLEVVLGQGDGDIDGNGTVEHVWQRNVFDYMGRPFYTYSSDGAWSKTVYSVLDPDLNRCPNRNEVAFVEIQTAAGGTEQWTCKDILGRDVRTITQGFSADQWIHTDMRYDYASRPIAVSEPYVDIGSSTIHCNNSDDATCMTPSQAFWTQTFYDDIGRVVRIKLPNGGEERFAYNGLTTTHTNALNQSTRTEHNVLGENVRQVHLSDGAMTQFGYDALGQLISTDGPIDQDTIHIAYDDLGNKIEVNDPDKGIWTYRYNPFGELLCQIDAADNGIAFEYDILGRQTARYDQTGVSSLATCHGDLSTTTTWYYSNEQGAPEFGQVAQEHTVNEAVPASGEIPAMPRTELTRDYDYDVLGRIHLITTTIFEVGAGTRSYVQETTYDQYGRVFQQFDASGGRRGERFVYNNQGYLEAIRDARFRAPEATVYRTVSAMNARGQVLEALLGNNTLTYSDYDPATGLPTIASETLLNGRNELAIFYDYAWDVLGRLRQRIDLSTGPRHEFYDYDDRNRLTEFWHSTAGGSLPSIQQPHGWTLQQHLRYDASGNILCKSDVAGLQDCIGEQTYSYGAGSAGPHAVTQVDIGGGYHRTFTYDANGNMTNDLRSGGGFEDRIFDYTAFNKVRRLFQEYGVNDRTSDFHYGPDRSRFLQRKREGAGVVARTHYIGNVEIEFHGNSFAEATLRRSVAGVVLDVITMTGAAGPQGLDGANQLSRLRYQHRDHLGSIVALSKANGELYTRMGFDPWGQRRDPDNAQVPWLQWVAPGALPFDTFTQPIWAQLMLEATPRGYTGHEHLDWHGVIHMNGRIYDPHLARFLQADPFMEDTGTLNRYSYVLNNPLMYTDPSGYFFGSFKDVFKTVISIAIAIAVPASWGVLGAMLAGAASGAIMTGSIEGALWGAFSAAVFFGIGQGFENLAQLSNADFLGTGLSATQFAQQSILHGIAGGTIAHVQGGKFGHGFLSAGVSKAATPGIMDTFNHPASQGIAVAIVGGTVSEVTGGKFANGAMTSAMSFAFGELAQRERDQGRVLTADERALAKKAFTTAFGTDEGFDYDAVRVIDGKFLPWQAEGYIMAPDGNIYWPGECGNLAICGGAIGSFGQELTASLFVHEMTHVHQYQQGTNVLLRGLFVQAGHFLRFYDAYELPLGVPYGQLNIEQQAEYVRYQLYPDMVETR